MDVAVKITGSVMSCVEFTEHPFVSVTTRVYDPGVKFVMDEVVAPVDQRYA